MPEQPDLDQVLTLLPGMYRSLGCLIGETVGVSQVPMSRYRAITSLRRAPGATLGNEEWAGFVRGLVVCPGVLDRTAQRKHDRTRTT